MAHDLPLWVTIPGTLLLVTGGIVTLVASFGLLRLPDFFARVKRILQYKATRPGTPKIAARKYRALPIATAAAASSMAVKNSKSAASPSPSNSSLRAAFMFAFGAPSGGRLRVGPR